MTAKKGGSVHRICLVVGACLFVGETPLRCVQGCGNWKNLISTSPNTVRSRAKQRTGSCDVLPHPSTPSSSSASARPCHPTAGLGLPVSSGLGGSVAARFSGFGFSGELGLGVTPTRKSALLVVGQRRPASRARRRLSSTPPFLADSACGKTTSRHSSCAPPGGVRRKVNSNRYVVAYLLQILFCTRQGQPMGSIDENPQMLTRLIGVSR